MLNLKLSLFLVLSILGLQHARAGQDILSGIAPEKPCVEATADQICEVLPDGRETWGPYFQRLKLRDTYEGEFIVEYRPPLLTVYALNPSTPTFVCCDIQSRLHIFDTGESGQFHFAQFKLPSDGFFEITLLGQRTYLGPRFFYSELDRHQRIYKETHQFEKNSKITKHSSDHFDRAIYIYQTCECNPPESVIYLKDGDDIYGYVRALEALYEQKDTQPPNLAIIGFESADSDLREREYIRWDDNKRTADNEFYDYSKNFRENLVPEIETLLGYENGADGRILSGKSAGGAWVISFALDNPHFAHSVWAFSPAGQPSGVLGTHRPPQSSSTQFIIGAGKFETAFAVDAEIISNALRERGFTAEFKLKNSGHNHTSWTPLFLSAIERHFGG